MKYCPASVARHRRRRHDPRAMAHTTARKSASTSQSPMSSLEISCLAPRNWRRIRAGFRYCTLPPSGKRSGKSVADQFGGKGGFATGKVFEGESSWRTQGKHIDEFAAADDGVLRRSTGIGKAFVRRRWSPQWFCTGQMPLNRPLASLALPEGLRALQREPWTLNCYACRNRGSIFGLLLRRILRLAFPSSNSNGSRARPGCRGHGTVRWPRINAPES